MQPGEKLESFTHSFARWAGTANGFITAGISVLVWIVAGNFFDYSNAWENALQIYISVITFLMIFLMQRAQNKGLAAVQLKLNELIASTHQADNSLINAEDLSEKEISKIGQAHREITTDNAETNTSMQD